jgi:drug/metabolite transporter (DMT)-like permease
MRYTYWQMKTKQKWFWICFVAALLAAPNALMLRHTSEALDPLLINAVRFGLAGLVFLPMLIKDVPRLVRSKKAFLKLLAAGLALAIAGVTYIIAIGNAPASYVSIIYLLSPIMLVVYARLLSRERMSSRAIAGIIIAAIGSMLVVVLPIAKTTGGEFVFYPIATIAALVSMLSYPATVVLTKDINKTFRVHILSIVSFSSLLTALVSLSLWGVSHSTQAVVISTIDMWSLLYAGLIVLGLSRALTLRGYKYVSTPTLGSLFYVESFLAVILPVVVLNEKLSVEMIAGGCLILLGVYAIEHHRSAHHKYHHVIRT